MKNIYKALANFQQEVPAVHEGTKGYGYTYSDLKTIFKVINPILKKHNLGFTQLLDGINIKTIIFHTESGESIESSVEIPQGIVLKGMNQFQVNGSGITYYRRYSLSSALGLVTDIDSDAKGEQQAPVKPIAVIKKAITNEQFESAKGFTEKQLKSVFDKFEFKDKAQEEELTEIYINLKNQ
tara:strand:- start:2166 stop:2711 length:546 start_codon:yes stop_codon:yes gene_type:complete